MVLKLEKQQSLEHKWVLDPMIGFNVIGKNLTDEDSIPMGTRWFDVLLGLGTIPQQLTMVLMKALGPRAVFRSFRKGSQLGVRSLDASN